MKTFNLNHVVGGAVGLGLGLLPGTLRACAVCFGALDEPMARGMNLGILALLGVTGVVLSGAAAFLVYLACQAKKAPTDFPGEDP